LISLLHKIQKNYKKAREKYAGLIKSRRVMILRFAQDFSLQSDAKEIAAMNLKS